MPTMATGIGRIDRLIFLLEHEIKSKRLKDVRRRLNTKLLEIFEEEQREVLAKLSKVKLPRMESRFRLEQGWEEIQAQQILLLIFDYEGNTVRVAQELIPFTEEATRLGTVEGTRILTQMVGFDVRHTVAEEWLREHAIEFGREYAGIISETTNKRIREALVKGLKEGDNLLGLRDRVKGIYEQFPNYRAQMIARTESSRAYSMGNLEVYGDVGVEKVSLIGCDTNCGQCGPIMAGGPYTIEEAAGIEMTLHPNHAGDWKPELEDYLIEEWRRAA